MVEKVDEVGYLVFVRMVVRNERFVPRVRLEKARHGNPFVEYKRL